MAINKNLPAGTILFLYHTAYYSERLHSSGRERYEICFHALHIHNRRERTAGANVPRSFIPALEKLGIRFEDNGHDMVTAIGCRNWKYHNVKAHLPYPSSNDMNQASEIFQSQMASGTTRHQDVDLIESEFMTTFVQKKMSNKDSLFALQPSIHQYVANETYVN